tara:strand:- start:825 stop:1520 length:696 start_codon:yes stop_codon:yes gene_type:complete
MKVINMTQRSAPGNTDVQGFGFSSGGQPLFTITPDASEGLLGILKNVSVNHHLDDPNAGVFEIKNGVILPKLIEIQVEFGAIHEIPLAQSEPTEHGTSDFESFPYGMQNTVTSLDKAKIAQQMDELHSAWTKAMQDQREAEREKELGDQAKENAEARYAGMFGKARFNKDKKRLQNGKIKNDEKRRYIQEAVVGQEMRNDNAGSEQYGTYAENNIDFYEEAQYDDYGEIIN